ncbi:uncharacterized protein (TIGR01244 family) [Natronospira proteinivora]|uniref:Uncharacterized protein (TIGR01244 family) n=1 Tax=Natronospira proteinivora TaxID=1807133 RepID=A0ABT1G4R9_9GAMM|nr:protein tyrosine phosphatase family protein [Natronospira proteinivora]MCP1726283.1 uncharacterized protein (TIGR01244 family) [Natronospira proteinivora]
MRPILMIMLLAASLGLAPLAFGNNGDGNMPDIPHKTQPDEKTLIGGQPSKEQFREMQAQGVQTVVNFRGSDEFDDWSEADVVTDLGMLYIHIPVAGADGLTRQAVSAFDRAVSAAGDEPVLYHCASGNRVGAMFALRAALIEDHSVEEAMEIGRKHGMTSLAEPVQEMLESGQVPDAE